MSVDAWAFLKAMRRWRAEGVSLPVMFVVARFIGFFSGGPDKLFVWAAQPQEAVMHARLIFTGIRKAKYRMRDSHPRQAGACPTLLIKTAVLLNFVFAGCDGAPDRQLDDTYGSQFLTKPQSTPLEAWQSLLSAMINRDEPAMRELTTKNGFACLNKVPFDGEAPVVVFEYMGRLWAEKEVNWQTHLETKETVVAFVGPGSRAHYVRFKRTQRGWKLDAWFPEG